MVEFEKASNLQAKLVEIPYLTAMILQVAAKCKPMGKELYDGASTSTICQQSVQWFHCSLVMWGISNWYIYEVHVHY